MLVEHVDQYLAVRRSCGFILKSEGSLLLGFAAFSDSRGIHHVRTDVAVQWAAATKSVCQRARRLGAIIRFVRYARTEGGSHELPFAVFGKERRPRPTPYILSRHQVSQLVYAASRAGYRTLRRKTYATLFALLSCTGMRISEAIALRFDDVTADGLVIRRTKFRKDRLIPLHHSAQGGLERYLLERRPYAPFCDRVFVSLRRKPLLHVDIESAFRIAADRIGLKRGPGLPRPTPHSLRHTFAVRALQTCPDDRDQITKHMVALSTYLGHTKVENTYWYLEATPDLMRDIAARCELFIGESS